MQAIVWKTGRLTLSSITPEAEAVAGSFWTIDHWLRHCEGFRVWDATVVRGGALSGELVTWPVEAVQSLDAETERVFVTSTAELPRRRTGR